LFVGVQHYVIKFVSDLRQVGSFFPGPPVSSTNKIERHDIAEILLKVAINTITLTPNPILMSTEVNIRNQVFYRWILNFVDQPTHENHKNWYSTNKSDFTVL
jgi:hypothetical protein